TALGSHAVRSPGRFVGTLPVREDRKALARRQVGHRAAPTPPGAGTYIRDAMKPPPRVVSPDMDVNDLRRAMLESRARYLPVMDGDVLLGVVSFHDVARAVLDEQSVENKMLKAYIRDWPAEG